MPVPYTHGMPFAQNTALLLIDVQQAFLDPAWGDRNNPEAERNILRLLHRWRETERPVIHIHHESTKPGGRFLAGSTGILPMAGAEPRPGETVYRKRVNSAFIGTALEADLRGRKVETLVVVGLTTPHCVSTTTRMAANLGFSVYLVSDATAAFTQTGSFGGDRTAGEVHAGALSDLQDEFATLIDTQTALDKAVDSSAAIRQG